MGRLYHYTLLRKFSCRTVLSEQQVSWTFILSRTETLENGLLNLLRHMLHGVFRIQIVALKLSMTQYIALTSSNNSASHSGNSATWRLYSQAVTSFEVMHS